MNSIRSQLLFWLVPSFIIIAILASASLYLSEHRRLHGNLDNELGEFARIIKLNFKRPPPRFARQPRSSQNVTTAITAKLEDINSGYYFQSWNDMGETLQKSISLSAHELSIPTHLTKSDDIVYNSQLGLSEQIRVHSFTLRGGPRRGAIEVAVAIDKTEINQRLTSFAIQLTLGSIFFCALLSALLILAITRALKTIEKLSTQVEKVEAGSLHNRLNEANTPKEIKPLVNRVNLLLARLENSFTRERQFNSDLAHELRTPLAAIRTTSEVALKWPEQSTAEDYQYIAEAAAQLQQTIDSLLSLARIENSGAEILKERVNIADIVDECLSLYSHRIKERDLVIDLITSGSPYLQSDPRLLRVIISNLISNAVEYTPVHSTIVINTQSPNVVLSVSNKAPNLSEMDVNAMFDRLWRKDSSRTGTKHVGLGLSIAHTAAQALSLNLSAILVSDDNNQNTLKMQLGNSDC